MKHHQQQQIKRHNTQIKKPIKKQKYSLIKDMTTLVFLTKNLKLKNA
jgi:hypothetical protein